MKRIAIVMVMSLLAALAGSAWAGGTAQVRFTDPLKYSDIGSPRSADNRNLGDLADHLKSLSASLPDGQQLQVEFTDIDLAGEVRWMPRLSSDVRVLTGGVDWPRLSLRWRLLAGEREIASGSPVLSDPMYLHQHRREQGALTHEKRLLDRWFAQQVLPVARR